MSCEKVPRSEKRRHRMSAQEGMEFFRQFREVKMLESEVKELRRTNVKRKRSSVSSTEKRKQRPKNFASDQEKRQETITSVRENVREEWSKILKNGLYEELKNEHIQEYLIKENYQFLKAQKLNRFLELSLSEKMIKSDKREISKQTKIASALIAIDKALCITLNRDDDSEKNFETVKFLVDVGRILADLHHSVAMKRRLDVVGAFDLGDIADVSPIENDLFSEQFSMILKSAKLILKSRENDEKIEIDEKKKGKIDEKFSEEKTSKEKMDEKKSEEKNEKQIDEKKSEEKNEKQIDEKKSEEKNEKQIDAKKSEEKNEKQIDVKKSPEKTDEKNSEEQASTEKNSKEKTNIEKKSKEETEISEDKKNNEKDSVEKPSIEKKSDDKNNNAKESQEKRKNTEETTENCEEKMPKEKVTEVKVETEQLVSCYQTFFRELKAMKEELDIFYQREPKAEKKTVNTPAPDESFPGIIEAVKRAYRSKGWPEGAIDTMVNARTLSTMKNYERAVNFWWDYCKQNPNVDVYDATARQIIQFFVLHEHVIKTHGVLATWRSAMGDFTSDDLGKDKFVSNYVKGFQVVKTEKK